MLRELQTTTGKVYDAMNKAAVAMVVGMGVVKDYTTNTVAFPEAATDKGIFFVTKEMVCLPMMLEWEKQQQELLPEIFK